MKTLAILIGTLFAALGSSACCWIPALLGATSAGTLGLGAALAPYRPYLIGLTFLFLGAAFYFTYRPPKPTCETHCCATTTSATKRLQKGVLWLVALFSLGMMAYPYVAAYRAQANAASASKVVPDSSKTIMFAIEKMTCAECAVQLGNALKKIPGVYDAKVDFETKRAAIRYDETRVNPAQLRTTIEQQGFAATETTTLRR